MRNMKAVALWAALTGTLFAAQYSGTMIEIPGGSFTMGDNAAKGPLADAHMPERTVTVSAYLMGETEVTNEQYVNFLNSAWSDGLIAIVDGVSMGQVCRYVVGNDNTYFAEQKLMALDGSRVLKDHDGDGTIDPENPLNRCWIQFDSTTEQFSLIDPVSVDWDAYPYETGESRSDWPELAEGSLPTLEEIATWAVGFIQWYGATVFAEYYGLRLPTEAEWEYAAQGGRGYAYGTDNGTLSAANANYNDAAVPGQTMQVCLHHVEPVKSYAPNPFGLYDLAGNVWEWCQDWFDENYYGESDNTVDPVNDTPLYGEPVEAAVPQGTSTATPPDGFDCRVRRGGSWNYHDATCKSSGRALDFHFRGNDHFGFRVVGDIQATSVANQSTVSFAAVNMTQSGKTLSISIPEGAVHNFGIFNSRGQLLREITVQGTASIELSGMSSGLYFLRSNSVNRSFILR